MTNLTSNLFPEHNTPTFTVGELSQALKRTLEEGFSYIRVRGEISGFKHHTSGHVYLSLKDQDALISVVCWRGIYQSFSLRLEDGMDVIATGRITTYPGRSQYQLVLERVELAGRGALLKLLEERKERLLQEGLFNLEHKRPLPFLPRVIGVITSPTGAVIQDILHRLKDRFPTHVLVWPVLVQGEDAAQQVTDAINGFNALDPLRGIPKPDLLIIARGGGSLEDLWAFNEECVIRAAANSVIPLISAIGHETDTTLLDFVADKRAPTPTAAAEIAVPVRRDLLEKLLDYYRRLILIWKQHLGEKRQTLQFLRERLGKPHRLLEPKIQKLDDLSDRLRLSLEKRILNSRLNLLRILPNLHPPRDLLIRTNHELKNLEARLSHSMESRLKESSQTLKHLGLLLESSSYTKILEKGFVLVRDGTTGNPIISSNDVYHHEILSLTFKDGGITAIAQK